RWTPMSAGAPTSGTEALARSPVHSGTRSLHLAATAGPAGGERAVWSKRGPSLRSGDAIVRVSVYPTRLDAGSGLYVSASLGGDPTVGPPIGYTTQAGVVSPGRSAVFVWSFGAAPHASFYPGAQVVTRTLGAAGSGSSCDGPFRLNTWITCTVDLNSALSAVPQAQRPLDDDA